jgi:SAM-dependent methyltransferase
MQDYENNINRHYCNENLGENIKAALKSAGKDIDALTREDIFTFDEFHIRGREATREFAQLAQLNADKNVLDAGCGLGGPARTIAEEFNCSVTGVDLSEEYCRIANWLTEKVGLSERVKFQHGNIYELPVPDNTFDIVMCQHALMNIKDKEKAFAQFKRVLKKNGSFVFYEILAGKNNELHYPVPWADDPSISFLVNDDHMKIMLERNGFKESTWVDVTAASLNWFKNIVNKMGTQPRDSLPASGINLLMGESSPAKSKNMVKNLDENLVKVVMAVYH